MMRLRRVALWTLVLLVVVGGVAGLWLRRELRNSLPMLDGTATLTGLSAPVTVTRDALGIPTIRGTTRVDVARATGFLHAQDRFFQMDLARRRAAGELAALVGARALPVDREIRLHRFRNVAERAVRAMAGADRALLDAYVAGVNAGLSSLRVPPFEYLVLRQGPQVWTAEDSLLVILSMFVTLQESDGAFEATLATMHDVLPPSMVEFLVPPGTSWDAPIVGGALPMPPVPPARDYDLRGRRAGRTTPSIAPLVRPRAWAGEDLSTGAVGSNAWAVDGSHGQGGALVANDVHLGIRVPNTWYRARLEWTDGGGHMLVGVTLPGVPTVVIGSNTRVAWGLTSSYADSSDIVLLETDAAHPGMYRTTTGWTPFERVTETLAVAGGPSESLALQWTIWGPVLPGGPRGRPRAYRWVAHDADRLAASVTALEDASTVDEAIDAAARLPAPAQNLVVADRSGAIAWGIFGILPHRQGFDGSRPTSWADGARTWSAPLEPSASPRVTAPEGGRIWTANARVVDGPMLDALGDGNWEIGARATIIRDRLLARDRFTPADMLAIQLDASATFLTRWRQLLLDTLTPEAVAGSPDRRVFREVVGRTWDGTASPQSAAYRFVRTFRDDVSRRVFAFVLAECYEADSTFDYGVVQRREGPLWALLTERPPHLLDPRYRDWTELLLASVDDIIEDLTRSGDAFEARTWGRLNVAAFRHPLSAAVPFSSRWLDMPIQPLPGDSYTPRVQWGSQGASVRMVVSPGRETDGLMEMPVGQSGHPLSPYYGNSHDAWVQGRPTPLLPGPAEHSLTLSP